MDAATFIKRVGRLPSLSSLYYELTRAVENPNASVAMIGDIVRKDPSMAARLLKLANSAYYGFPSKVMSIEDALQLIGMREMRDMALATSVIGAFKNVPQRLLKVPDFWRHCIACGVACSLLAQARKEAAPERFFVAGLLHDIGRLAMYWSAPVESEQILRLCESEKNVSCNVETRILGFDHADLGAELLNVWKLPQSLVSMVGHHHYPGLYSAFLNDEILVHTADFLVTALDIGSSGEHFLLPLFTGAEKCCDLSYEQLESTARQIEERTDALNSILAE